MHVAGHKDIEVREIVDLPLIAAGFIFPFLFLGIILLERDFQVYESLIGFFSQNYGIEFLLAYADYIFLALPFAGLLIAILARLLLGRAKGMLAAFGLVSVEINSMLVGIYVISLVAIFVLLP